MWERRPLRAACTSLDSLDVACSETLRPFGDVKAHSFALLQRTGTHTLNGQKVDEYVLTGFALDKPVTLVVIEPLYSSLVLSC